MNNLFGFPDAVVYMIQYSNEPIYKIGHTSDLNTRLRRIGILMPHPIYLTHVIYTNDPKWLESYWHNRFSEKRRPGSGIRRASEWFDLTEGDARDFKSHEVFNKPEQQKEENDQQILQEQTQGSLREASIIRVVKYFNDLIRQHPQRAVKLVNACNFQINQLNAEILRMQSRSILEEEAINRWEQRACRSADKKVQ